MEETLRLLRSVDAVHGAPAGEAARRLEEAMELIARHEAEHALHPELRKERYTLASTVQTSASV